MAQIMAYAMDRYMLTLTEQELGRLGDDPVAGLENLLNPPAPKKTESKPVKKTTTTKSKTAKGEK